VAPQLEAVALLNSTSSTSPGGDNYVEDESCNDVDVAIMIYYRQIPVTLCTKKISNDMNTSILNCRVIKRTIIRQFKNFQQCDIVVQDTIS
jgi:hypothetical protein